MAEFFEFEKRYSDGIRRKHTPHVPSSAPVQRKSGREEPKIRVTSYGSERAEGVLQEQTEPSLYFDNASDRAIVSEATAVAHKENIPAFPVVAADQKTPIGKRRRMFPWKRAYAKANVSKILKLGFKKQRNDEISLSEEIRDDTRAQFLKRGIFAGVACLGIAAVIFSLYFSHLAVTITPFSEPYEMHGFQVLVQHTASDVDTDRHVIPAERLEFSRAEKQTFSATGKKYVKSSAHGIARIYNRFNTSPQRLVAGTRFATGSGSIYRLTRAVLVPGGLLEGGKLTPRFVEAELVFDKTGPEGNVSGQVTLKIPGFQGTPRYDGFYAEALSGFQGGAAGESAVAAKEDIARAQEEVTKKVFDALKAEMSKKIPPDFKVLDGLSEIQITDLKSPRESAPGDTFDIEAHAAGRILVFRDADIAALLKGTILKDQADKEEIQHLDSLSYAVKNADLEKGSAELSLGGNVYVKHLVSGEEVAALLKGKPERELAAILKKEQNIGNFSLKLFPPWVFHAPSDASRIQIMINGQ